MILQIQLSDIMKTLGSLQFNADQLQSEVNTSLFKYIEKVLPLLSVQGFVHLVRGIVAMEIKFSHLPKSLQKVMVSSFDKAIISHTMLFTIEEFNSHGISLLEG